MQNTKTKIQKFTDLEAWKAAHNLAVSIYRVTKSFPKDEQFGITNQMRRAAVSVGSNIAEGFSRFSARDKSQFYTIAKGSATELESQLLLSHDLGYVASGDLTQLNKKIEDVGRLLTGLLKFTRNHA